MPDAVFDYDGARWKRLRAAVLRRDAYQCRRCCRFGRIRQAEIVHHIKEAEAFPELAYNAENLVSLCRECHNKAHPEKGGPRGYRGGPG